VRKNDFSPNRAERRADRFLVFLEIALELFDVFVEIAFLSLKIATVGDEICDLVVFRARSARSTVAVGA
jgi:hypothetical protein